MTDQFPYQPPPQQPFGSLPYASWQHPVPMKHSGFGIASFIIGMSIGVLEMAMIVLAAVLVQQKTSQQSPGMITAGCGMLAGLAACVMGVVLGVVGVRQTDRKRIFAILGLCANSLILLTVLGLMAIGLALK